VDTGDGIRSIEGIFSGTLAYLLNSYDGSVSFGELVRNARELGYTEPDPRDDLSGLDVARKLVILARERGLRTTLADVQLESLVPDSMRGIPLERFLESLNALDAPMRTRLDAARSRCKVLRYVARVGGDGEASVGLVELPATHAFAHIQLTDNVVQFTTDRYCHNPLVVQGPGAGPEVTATGVFADVLRVATALGAHL
jgi:aspartokinase/homoserine dehydrogenase 1